MNKCFFKFKNDLSIKSILEYLNISEKKFYNYNNKNTNIDEFKINQFSSLSNSLDDSLIFLNKNISDNLKDIKGVCLTKVLSWFGSDTSSKFRQMKNRTTKAIIIKQKPISTHFGFLQKKYFNLYALKVKNVIPKKLTA